MKSINLKLGIYILIIVSVVSFLIGKQQSYKVEIPYPPPSTNISNITLDPTQQELVDEKNRYKDDPKYYQTDEDCSTTCQGYPEGRGTCYNQFYLGTITPPMQCRSKECRPNCTTCTCINNQCTDKTVPRPSDGPCC